MGILTTIKNYQLSTALIFYQVLLCLLPGVLVLLWFFGISFLAQIILAIFTGLITESIILQLRSRPILTNIFDGSGILTAILLAISIPPIAPWWIIVIGTFFAITFGKQLYGGLGHNIFNPAMLGFVMLIISFPKEMTLWSNPAFYHDLTIGTQLNLIFSPQNLDGITGATPLAALNTALNQGINATQFLSERSSASADILNASVWVNLAFLLGGTGLLFFKVIDWRIPITILASLAFFAAIFNISNSDYYPPVLFHLLAGATMIGAFFIATDPVTASTTPKGRYIYGALIGFILYIIRSFGTFHDAVAFAILFVNMLVPLIDQYTKPKPFGKIQ